MFSNRSDWKAVKATLFSVALATVASTAIGRNVRGDRPRRPVGGHVERDDAAAAPDFERLGDQVRVHRLDVADEKFRTRVGQRVVHPGRNIDHQTIGVDSLRNRLAADQRLMGGLDIELRGADEVGNPQLAENGGPRRRNPPLGLEISDVHMTSPSCCRRRFQPARRRTGRKGAPAVLSHTVNYLVWFSFLARARYRANRATTNATAQSAADEL